MMRYKKYILFSFLLALCFAGSGCYRYIIGTYVRQPQPGQPGRHTQSFVCSWEDGFDQVEVIIGEMQGLIFYKSKKEQMISAMHFHHVFRDCIDTTEVGIFFKGIDESTTQVDVACGNYPLAEFVSQEIYSRLEKKFSQPQ